MTKSLVSLGSEPHQLGRIPGLINVYKVRIDSILDLVEPESCVQVSIGDVGGRKHSHEQGGQFTLADLSQAMCFPVPTQARKTLLLSGLPPEKGVDYLLKSFQKFADYIPICLTETFCLAILEAASCGFLTVRTCVGGVTEVLPDGMIVLVEPDPNDMVHAIQKAISMLPKIDPQMRELYNWHDVAKRTEIVYDHALKCSNQNLLERLSWYTVNLLSNLIVMATVPPSSLIGHVKYQQIAQPVH
ncbi:hypothetical protein RJT34_08394 [Clitoria ternatea]|uniref:Glycosyl transferase family 1 domain-containing protein n=1 Tax=Clitoria ternatea TaxID=43366 RepID=A0AAN9PSR7_CLITE